MGIDTRTGKWGPRISQKQAAVINDRLPYRLLAGPRKSSKTIGGLHTFTRHIWQTKAGRYSVVGRTLTDNADGGAWNDLIEIIFPEWMAAGFGFKYVTKPKLDGLTHKMFCEVTNRHRGVTRIQLDSVKLESEVERIFKGKRFAGIYMTELSNFKKRKTFDIVEESLRMMHLTPEEHLLIGDTNPAEEGEDSWIHKLWYEFRIASDEELMAYIPEGLDEDKTIEHLLALKELQAKLSVHNFTIDDNIFLSDAQKRAQFAKYAHDQDLLDRYYYGKWKKATVNGLFKEQFRPNIHVIGDEASVKADPEFLVPEENCSQLGSSWDIGGVNNAAHIIEKTHRMDEVEENGQKVEREVSVFKILDEHISVATPMLIGTLVDIMLEKMEFWESKCSSTPQWRHISDRSAWDFDNKADVAEYKQVYLDSNGRITLEPGPVKKNGSVLARVKLMQKLFFQQRLLISKHYCPQTVEMFKNIEKGRIRAIDPHSKWKHAFDSITYFICKECFAEMEKEMLIKTSTKPRVGGRIVRLS